MKNICFTSFVLIGLFVNILNASASSMMDGFIDPQDGMFDLSHWLAEKKGFFPVPIIVTEPAIGYGVGAALVFLHDPLAGRTPEDKTFDPQSNKADGQLTPPSISAVFGAYTENDTWMAGGVHFGVWKNDTVRYTGALATGSINMKFYGLGQSQETAIDFNLEPDILYQSFKFRIRNSGFFAGINYLLIDTVSKFDASVIKPGLTIDGKSRDAAIILSLDFDTRNTIFTPDSGFNAALEAMLFNEAVGSDSDFEKYKAKILFFTPVSTNVVLGLRGDVETVSGDVKEIPFYQYPFVNLRGIPIMRYQGDSVAVAEAEVRWNFTPRWSVVGFGGVGRTSSTDIANNETTVYSKGAGLRYLIARRFAAHVGFDIAQGPEDTAFYLQFGHAWQ